MISYLAMYVGGRFSVEISLVLINLFRNMSRLLIKKAHMEFMRI